MFLCVCVRIFPEVYREVERTAPPAGADRSGSGRPACVEGPCDPGVLSSRTTGWAPPPWGMGSRRRPSLRGPPTLGRALSPGAESRAASPRRRVPGTCSEAGWQGTAPRQAPAASFLAGHDFWSSRRNPREKQATSGLAEGKSREDGGRRAGWLGRTCVLCSPRSHSRNADPAHARIPASVQGRPRTRPLRVLCPAAQGPAARTPRCPGPAAGLRTLRRCPCGTF